MNIYFITIDRPLSYGDYISAIVFAESVDQARLIHPKGSIYDFKCDPDHADYEELDMDNYQRYDLDNWCHPDKVLVSLIGVATESTYQHRFTNPEKRKHEIGTFVVTPNTVLCSNNVGN